MAKAKTKLEYSVPQFHNDQANQVYQIKPRLVPTKLL